MIISGRQLTMDVTDRFDKKRLHLELIDHDNGQ